MWFLLQLQKLYHIEASTLVRLVSLTLVNWLTERKEERIYSSLLKYVDLLHIQFQIAVSFTDTVFPYIGTILQGSYFCQGEC